MLDLAKSFFLVFLYLFIFTCLGSFLLHALKERFSFSLSLLSGFFLYHFLFSLAALPCILTLQTLTLLMWIWLPILAVLLGFSLWFSRGTIVQIISSPCVFLPSGAGKKGAAALALAAVLLVLYLSVCSYYVGWDTAFYVRTTLHAVENDSMYTLDTASGTMVSALSLRYALSPFYMNSAIFCRLLNLHPLMVQNIADGSLCVILAFTAIYRIGLLIFDDNRTKAWLAVFFAAIIHISHSSLFSASDFLLLRSYEAKAYCANVVLPFVFYCMIRLWKHPESRTNWILLFCGTAAAVPVSMSSLVTVPLLAVSCSCIWLIRRNWICLRNMTLCLLPCLFYLGASLLEYAGLIVIPVM